MKIKISRNQWKEIGKKTGWIKQAQLMSYFEEVDIGPSPNGESCAQVGSDNYQALSRMELKAYRNQLQRMFPNIPDGAYYKIKANQHDFGTYHEIVIKFPEDNEAASEYAYNVQNNSPENWDEQAKQELQQQGYFDLLKGSK
jgi:hypothetical protein